MTACYRQCFGRQILYKMEFLYEQSELIFNRAIECGIFSDDNFSENYAGNYMYMYTIKGTHYFKNSFNRKYIMFIDEIQNPNVN
jgi:hypothetical protein